MADRDCATEEPTIKSTVTWPRLVESWVPRRERKSAILPQWAEGCGGSAVLNEGELFISGITNESTLLSAAVSEGFPKVPLRAVGAVGRVSWYLNGEHISTTEPHGSGTYQLTGKGDFQLVAVDEEDSKSAMIVFYVD